MVRQPFSNTLPDYVVLSERTKALGAGGLLAAGFWGNSWEFRQDIAFTSSCKHASQNQARKREEL